MNKILLTCLFFSFFSFTFAGTLKIFSNKDNMQVLINKKEVTTLMSDYIELELPEGKYEVTLKKPIDDYTEYSITKNILMNTDFKTIPMHASRVMRKDTFNRLLNTFEIEGFQNKKTHIVPAMVKIKAGSFEKTLKKNTTTKLITIENDFYIGKYEVTIAEYMKFVNDTNSNYPSWLKYKRYNIFKNNPDFYLKCPTGDCPIIGISWEDAKEYTKWLSKKTKETYKLPSENQWEYVAKANSTTKFFWGNDKEKMKDYVICNEESTSKVGSKKSNPWEVFDILGNVYEFCEDDYSKDYEKLPNNQKAYKEIDSQKVVRKGGAWDDSCKEFYQSYANRVGTKKDWKIYNYGFRLIKTIK